LKYCTIFTIRVHFGIIFTSSLRVTEVKEKKKKERSKGYVPSRKIERFRNQDFSNSAVNWTSRNQAGALLK
jgi:predicted NUDIX family phosphoesterase